MHWCENVLFMGWVGIFFVWGGWPTVILAVIIALAIYFLEIFIDNNFARVKWQFMFKSAWLIALVVGAVNLSVLMFL
jgi:ech hydrogenase subunit B